MARIDHFFVFCQPCAPERRRLLARGLAIGAQRDHPGQGTANVCFGFADCYLELIWLADEAAAHAPVAAPLALDRRARWRLGGASPFGVCVRPDAPAGAPPFAHWHYRPPYLPAGMQIAMADNGTAPGEPLLFQIDRPYQSFGVAHDLAAATLTALVVTTPGLAPRRRCATSASTA